MASFDEKLQISLGSGIMLGLIYLPTVFKTVNNVLPLTTVSASGCPNYVGQLLHLAVFAGLSYLSMPSDVDAGVRAKHTLYGALIAFFVMSPAMFKLMRSILGGRVATPAGCPTMFGLFLHSAVYVGALVGVMYLPN